MKIAPLIRATFLLPFVLLMSVIGFGQSERYKTEVFESVDIESDVAYGRSVTQGGVSQKLIMDIYTPAGDDNVNRPLVILAHGGYFMFGDKMGFKEEAEFFAKSGFVVASIDYRLIDVEESEMVSKIAVIDAVNDLKAAVRFFNKDHETSNKYKIDPNQITIGGYSAGAVTSLHYAYATTPEDVMIMGGKELLTYVIENGGLEGKSGNPGYSSQVKSVINIAGSLHNAGLVNKGEPLLVSIHGTADDVVPFLSGDTGETGVVTEGSGLIHGHADKIGLINKLIQLENEDHFARYSCEDCMRIVRQFLTDNF